MKVSIGCDHGGFLLKEHLKKYLENTGRVVIDHGCYDNNRVDYPDHALKVAKDVQNKNAEYGLLVCTTGIGMSITANKFKNVRAALVTNIESAHLTRMHNNSNVICLGAKFTPYEEAIAYIDAFLTEQFEGGRHQRRVDQIEG